MNLEEKYKHLERLSWLNSHLSHKYMVDNNILPANITNDEIRKMEEYVKQEAEEFYKSLKYFYGEDEIHKTYKEKK